MDRAQIGSKNTDLNRLDVKTGGHQVQDIGMVDPAIHQAHISHHTFIGIIMRVKDQCPQGGIFVPFGGRNFLDNHFQHRIDVGAFLGGNADDLVRQACPTGC